MIKALIFDFDGVILESVDIKTDAFCEIFKNTPKIVGQVREYQMTHGGISRQEKFKYFYKNLLNQPLTDEKLKELCDQFEALVFKKVLTAVFVPGAEDLLKSSLGQYKMFVCSGTPEDELNQIVVQRSLKKYFEGVYGSPKTKDVIIKNILQQHSLSAHEVLFVGDSTTDFEASKKTGANFVARVTSDASDWINDPYVLAKYDDLCGVEAFIKKFNKKS